MITSVVGSVIFFIIIGSVGVDLSDWQDQSFLPEGWNGVNIFKYIISNFIWITLYIYSIFR